VTATTNPEFPHKLQIYEANSIITCFYNREKGELSFTYNGIDMGVGYRDIPTDKDYYAAASVYSDVVAEIKLLDMKFPSKNIL
jgi:hypothetical protein